MIGLFLQDNMKDIKQKLYQSCQLFIADRLKTITDVMEANQSALLSETKSSAGDKHETGRAMLQLEMEKAGQQLASVKAMQEVLKRININNKSNVICLGSLVVTDKAAYFLAISAGKITIDGVDYFAISSNSPIGKQLLGKKKVLSFRLMALLF